jgi:hypothetical protein
VSVPPVAMLPPTTPTSSVTEVPAEITAASLVPLIVTTTVEVVPSSNEP